MADKGKRTTPMKVFVEIGVGLLNTCHQLLENGWRGIMIEPLKEVCDKIVPHPNLSVENVAISTEQGTEILLRVKDENIYKEPNLVLGMSGLKKGYNPLLGKMYDGFLNEIEVHTVTIQHIIEKYKLKEIDFLKVDTEGMDIEILTNYSFDILPTMIKFEHVHGSGTIYDYSFVGLDQIAASQKYLDLIDRLKSLGYLVYQENEDVYCIR